MTYLQPAIAQTLPQLRAEAEARMLSTAVVRRTTGKKVQDETTGAQVPVWAEVHSGPFRLAGTTSGADRDNTADYAQGVQVSYAVRVGHFPATVDALRDGDLVDIVAGENAGTVWRIEEVDWKDQATARRVRLTAAQRPAEWPQAWGV